MAFLTNIMTPTAIMAEPPYRAPRLNRHNAMQNLSESGANMPAARKATLQATRGPVLPVMRARITNDSIAPRSNGPVKKNSGLY